MRTYLIFNILTNKILSRESRSDDSFPIPREGYAFLELFGELKSADHYYIKDSQIKLKSEQPDELFEFNEVTEQWEYSESLYNLKVEIAQEIALQRRLDLLKESDWTDTVSAVERLGQSKYQEWQTYRQALRDIPEQTGFPLNVVYPTPPN